jgi:hypothetical protein
MGKLEEIRDTTERYIKPRLKRRESAWKIRFAPRPVPGQLSFDFNVQPGDFGNRPDNGSKGDE